LWLKLRIALIQSNMSYTIVKAERADLEKILDIQKRAFLSEADIYGCCSVPPLSQTIEDIAEEFSGKIFLKALEGRTVIGSVRASEKNGVCLVEKLIVEPRTQNKGIGRSLMLAVEKEFPAAKRFELVTGHKSIKNIHLYSSLGYNIVRQEKKTDTLELAHMAKDR